MNSVPMNTVLAAPAPAVAGRQAVYVRELVVRVIHWTVFVCVAVLVVTGLDISHPFLLAVGDERGRFVTGTVRVIHFYAAMVFDIAVFARIAWMFVGNRYARWDQFIPVSRRRWRSLVDSLKYYLFLRDRPAPTAGHDGFDGVIFTARFLVDLAIIGTGFALYSRITRFNSLLAMFRPLVPLFGGLQSARWIHHMMMWVAIAFIIQHIARVVTLSAVKHDGTVDSMFSGYKFVTPEELAADRDDTGD